MLVKKTLHTHHPHIQYCLVWAVQLESPARVTVVRSLQIILAYAVQVITSVIIIVIVMGKNYRHPLESGCDV